MQFDPINENPKLSNTHTLYLARSGYGKSQTLLRKSQIPSRGARVVLWDNNQDHPANRYNTLGAFFKALGRALKSGRGFRIAYTGEASPDVFERWAKGVWSMLDGNKMTYIIIEEYSDCCRGPGALSPAKEKYHRRLWTQGRKYGAVIHATSQRPQLISKDALGNAGVIWASSMDSRGARRIGDEIDVHQGELRGCEVGEFYHWSISSDAQKQRVFTPI